MLVDLLRQSNENAFNEIYKRYWLRLFRYAITKVHDQQVAEDICHDVFLSLWQRRTEAAIINIEAYLVQAVKYRVISHLKQRLAEEQKVSDVHGATTDNTTENSILHNDLLQAWHNALQQLPEKSRQVFEMSRISHLNNKEIALQLNLSEKAVEYHITKALKILRLHLKDFALLACLVEII
jgi:RNA polymerase sigma-70 factor (family 1)